MKIIILGAGQVGSSVAHNLSSEFNDITVVDGDAQILQALQDRLIIAGGGNIGLRLAAALEANYQAKIIDRSIERMRMLSARLESAIVLKGDAADEELLMEESIENTDVFCALTNDEEANILSAMLAKRLGARRVMALINRASYVDLVHSEVIDIALSPRHHRQPAHPCAARPRRSRLWRTATAPIPRSSAAACRTSRCRQAPPSAPSCAANR